jgi:hypothetical protein
MDMAHERDANSEEEVMAGELRHGPWTVEVRGSSAHQLRCHLWQGLVELTRPIQVQKNAYPFLHHLVVTLLPFPPQI